jgi:hypothetical protein
VITTVGAFTTTIHRVRWNVNEFSIFPTFGVYAFADEPHFCWVAILAAAAHPAVWSIPIAIEFLVDLYVLRRMNWS